MALHLDAKNDKSIKRKAKALAFLCKFEESFLTLKVFKKNGKKVPQEVQNLKNLINWLKKQKEEGLYEDTQDLSINGGILNYCNGKLCIRKSEGKGRGIFTKEKKVWGVY